MRVRLHGQPGWTVAQSSVDCIPAPRRARYGNTKDNGIMKRLIATVALLAVSAFASAQALVSGEVKKVDKPAGRITLKHAEIKAYDMPGMTGAYKVQDPSMLDKVQVGDHVQFQLDRLNSVYTITKIDVQK
jgi:Cu(I)/Ag(I) efflux system protein CusF